MNTVTSTKTRSAIGYLLDMLIKHGTLPNMPIPDNITNAQVELAALELTIEIQSQTITAKDAEIERLHAVVEAANNLANTWIEEGKLRIKIDIERMDYGIYLTFANCGLSLAAVLERLKAEER